MVIPAVVAAGAPLRERLVMDTLMQVIHAPFELFPVLTDMAFWATGLLLGAEALQISIATVKRDWDFVRTWLANELGG